MRSITFIAALRWLGFGALCFAVGYFLQKSNAPTDHHQHAKTESEILYTCSMDPQVRQSEPGDCPICGMELIPLAEANGAGPNTLVMSADALKLAEIQTTLVGGAAQAVDEIFLNGKIEPDERRVASQVAHVAGRIEQLFVTYTGERVRAGQALARLYAPELVNAQEELLAAIRLRGANSELAEAARRRLRAWKLPNKLLENLEQNGTIQREVVVRADRGGVVARRQVAVGDYVAAGTPLLELIDLQRLWAVFEAYESDLPRLPLGATIAFSTPALPGKTFQARVSYIDPFIDPATRTASLRAEINNPQQQLKPEMFIRGTVSVGNSGSKVELSIPKTAVLWTGKRSVVYVRVAAATPTFEFREVVLGEPRGEHYPVLEGLSAGEEVVTHGAFVIDAAAQLNNQNSMINRRIAAGPVSDPDYQASRRPEQEKGLAQLLDQYLALKDALVADNPGVARQVGKKLLAVLTQAPNLPLQNDADRYWAEHWANALTHTQVLERGDLAEQRQQFEGISRSVIKLVKAFGSQNGQYYLQHCPMAFDDRGADWLSQNQEVRNPYFGAEMLTCGTVKAVLD